MPASAECVDFALSVAEGGGVVVEDSGFFGVVFEHVEVGWAGEEENAVVAVVVSDDVRSRVFRAAGLVFIGLAETDSPMDC